ncbi:NTE family protein [Alkalithermobacter thermoalcaliphilus JW-YL-7 = DSM 7308]|uniref:NTE family protein n=1 Tax=Alkalithermobacter thermoalcaliphilus JW-YL-7 = DSM 7308 TaxID=1121328 RepID=A0A150FRT8_CLOPD|nr:Patatin [[Clostridium] paradoxum JW-YL-7 = DSM 7308]SHK37506.1 NTE family protein [[Clostridium] paradoxum JW-YL-7 = DSM 7308]
MKIGLALSGGGVRGAAHIGVLKVLESYGIRPDFIAGTSSGSIVASLYALGYSVEEIENSTYLFNDFIDIDYFGLIKAILFFKKSKITGILNGDKLEESLNKLMNNKKMYETRIPLAVTAVDINNCKKIVFCSKQIFDIAVNYELITDIAISDAVRASCSIPLIFKPKMININDNLVRLVDGGVLDNLPLEVLIHMGADKVLGVNLGYNGMLREDVDNGFEVLGQSLDIMMYEITKLRYNKYSNISYVMNPEIWDVGLLDKEKINECIYRGEIAAKRHINDILNFLKK